MSLKLFRFSTLSLTAAALALGSLSVSPARAQVGVRCPANYLSTCDSKWCPALP